MRCAVWWALSLAAACHGELDFNDAIDGSIAVTVDAGDDASGGDIDCRTAACPLPTLHCELASGMCVACVADTDCASPNPRCDTALHRCVACGTGVDCPSGQSCAQGVCIPSCPDGGACPQGFTCQASSSMCVECTVSSDCKKSSKARLCQTKTGRCVECRADTDCTQGHPRCDTIAGTCVRCLSSADCPSAQRVCDPATLGCVHP